MNVSTLQTLSFTLLFIISTSLGQELHPDPVLDWAGNPVEAGVPYELWNVGYHKGPIGAGSFTDQSLGQQYVIDKQWQCNKTFDGNPVLIFPERIFPGRYTVQNRVVPVATNCVLKFVDKVWVINTDAKSVIHNFIITSTGINPHPDIGFQFIPVKGTITNPYLYKLITKRYRIPTDIISVTNPAGEKSLYLNLNNSILDTWGTRISFVKSRQSQILTKASN